MDGSELTSASVFLRKAAQVLRVHGDVGERAYVAMTDGLHAARVKGLVSMAAQAWADSEDSTRVDDDVEDTSQLFFPGFESLLPPPGVQAADDDRDVPDVPAQSVAAAGLVLHTARGLVLDTVPSGPDRAQADVAALPAGLRDAYVAWLPSSRDPRPDARRLRAIEAAYRFAAMLAEPADPPGPLWQAYADYHVRRVSAPSGVVPAAPDRSVYTGLAGLKSKRTARPREGR